MPATEITDFLRANPVFAALPVREVQALAAVAREEPVRARDYVFMEGDPAAWFCVVRSGHVKILRHARTGRDVVLELLGPGELFGGVAAIERRPYPASAQATEASVVVKIPQEAIVGLADPVEARLAGALLRLAEREGTRGPAGITLPFHLTRQSLADMTGTTVETAIRVVSRWLKDRVVAEDGPRLVLRDVDTLRSLAEGDDT